MTVSERSRAVRLLKWAALTVIAVELLLVATRVLDLGDAVIIAIGLEALCGVLALSLAVTARVMYRRLRQAGVGRWDAFLQAASGVLPRPMVTLLRHELGGLVSMILLLRRRKDVPAGATVIRYGAAHKAFLLVMIVLTPVEIVLVELLVPWAWLRIGLLVLAAFGLEWLFGFFSGVHTRPHYVDAHRLVLRTGHLAAVSVDVSSIRAVRREIHDKYKGLVSVKDDVVAVPGMSGTALTVTLEPGTPVRVQGRGTVHAREVRFDADDLDAAIRSIRERAGSLDGR
ncbi:hypothetical protein [Micromonospora eburnea]|uniref:Uncharacterized protein n=1 Tax=Micromonospora eburnea TaxID=227316 RepID=A0A1C6UAX5_9ACTN|nr:hypothetical protein [Micromonospora eburnea]SCL51128.1 hypothetical protein GA0070604_2290 [Micromonospora eburnea]